MIIQEEIGKLIGVITQIVGDQEIYFIVNNEIQCRIGDIVGIETGKQNYTIAKVYKIDIDFYLDNTNQFFISKAVDNNIGKLIDSDNKPRYGQYVKATILGHYKLSVDNVLKEIKSSINRCTPNIFQGVFRMDFQKTLEIYGLTEYAENSKSILNKTINLGQVSFPTFELTNVKIIQCFFRSDTFKKHTLITGVTGSGKSRLASLLVKELASIGAHISILDPHDEYISLLENSDAYHIFKLGNNYEEYDATKYAKNVHIGDISFYEGYIGPDTLTKLLPSLSDQQEDIIYEILNEFHTNSFSLKRFIDKLMSDLNIELKNDYALQLEEIKKLQIESEKAPNHTTFISLFIRGLKNMKNFIKPNRANILVSIIAKVNELRENNLIVNIVPNWLRVAPNSIDLFTIDYSANSYIRRYINSIIQYFLRRKNQDEFRVLVIDEAHMLLNEKSLTSQLVKQLLREARKFNITVFFISQNIKDIPDEIRSQFQNQFMFRDVQNESTRYFPDQICEVSLYSSKSEFAMRVKNFQPSF